MKIQRKAFLIVAIHLIKRQLKEMIGRFEKLPLSQLITREIIEYCLNFAFDLVG